MLLSQTQFKQAAGALVGNWMAEAFLLKEDPNDQGLVEVAPGFGLDDVVRALAIVVGIAVVSRVWR